MHAVILRINDICLRLLDNSQLDQILEPPTTTPPALTYKAPRYAVCAVKNTRRKMEDRHTCIDDFNSIFNIEDTERTSFYAVFDGHAGQDAAYYSVAHLHQNIASSHNYPKKPIEAIRDAFHKTDLAFLEKCKRENLSSGTTAVCALYRPVEKKLYVGWVGDSQALLVKQGNSLQIVNPHKASSEVSFFFFNCVFAKLKCVLTNLFLFYFFHLK